LNQMAQTVNTSKSFNITGAKVNIKSKKPQFYDPANVAFTYTYIETNQHSSDIKQNLIKSERAAIDYSFSFTPQTVEPFKRVKALDSPIFKIIKDFNFNYLPSTLSYISNLNRQYSQVELRDLNSTTAGVSAGNLNLTSSRDFMWNRQFNIVYDLSRSIKFSLQTAMNSSIDEGLYTPEMGKEYYETWRDKVWSNIKKLGTPYAYQQVFSASWNLPINKLPLMDWVTGLTASYNSNYKWDRMAQLKGDAQLGNIATSTGTWQLDGQFNFENLYNKSKYLKDVNQRFMSSSNSETTKFQPKSYIEKVKLEKNKTIIINHRLGSDKLKFNAIDKKGKPVTLFYKTKGLTSIEITPGFNADSVQLTMVSMDPTVQNVTKTTVDFVVRALMMVRKASISYRQSNSMVLSGFLPQAGFFGQQNENGVSAPGYGFTFGFIDKNAITNAWKKGWLSSDSTVAPATTAYTKDLNIKASLEPIPGFKIDLNATRYEAENTSVQYQFPGMPTTLNGGFNMTIMALGTAFKTTGTAKQNYNSELFNKLLSNRQVIANRLNTRFVNEATKAGLSDVSKMGTYSLNSADVLIPSFIAAYTGHDVNSVDTSPFLSLLSMLPNWRVNYDGLSNIDFIKNIFKSVSLTHAYTCHYNIGSYSSYSTWVAIGDESNKIGYVRDVQTNNPIASSPYDISDVSINEQFSPLIGINVVMKNSMTGKLEYKKSRTMDLNLSSTQLIESSNNEFVVGLGYILKDFDVILKLKSDKQTKVKNDLTLSADLSYKDIKTLLRKVQENITQASTGNKQFSLKVIADYVFSSKVNIQLFYDKQMSTPLISSSFPVSSSNFGVSFKFMLMR